MLLALEDGFRLHRLIDPASTPADSFVRSISELQKLRAAKEDCPSSPAKLGSLPRSGRRSHEQQWCCP